MQEILQTTITSYKFGIFSFITKFSENLQNFKIIWPSPNPILFANKINPY